MINLRCVHLFTFTHINTCSGLRAKLQKILSWRRAKLEKQEKIIRFPGQPENELLCDQIVHGAINRLIVRKDFCYCRAKRIIRELND